MTGYFNSAKTFKSSPIGFVLWSILSFPLLGQPLDYSKDEFWLVSAEKVPEFFKQDALDSTWISKVDVFYVYPTFLSEKRDLRWNAPMQDEKLQKKILNKAVKFQASAWLECGRLFVPYYRQAHLRAYDSLHGRGREALLFAYQDVAAAFEYYLDHYNQGRPFILAGHSQGSTQLTLLLKNIIDGKSLSNQLIAAYLPGVGIESNEFKQLEFMTLPSQFGGFVTWNTMYDKPDDVQYPLWYKDRLCINPLSWDLSPFVNRTQHQGFLYSNGKLRKQCFDAELCQGAVCLKKAKWPISWVGQIYTSLHPGDVNLFWKDIGMNAKTRISAFFLNESQH